MQPGGHGRSTIFIDTSTVSSQTLPSPRDLSSTIFFWPIIDVRRRMGLPHNCRSIGETCVVQATQDVPVVSSFR